MPLHQQTFRLIYNIVVDVADGRAARGLMDEIAEIAGRISQFRGAIGYGGQTERQLSVFAELSLQQVVEALQQIIAALVFLGNLALIDAVAVFQYQA